MWRMNIGHRFEVLNCWAQSQQLRAPVSVHHERLEWQMTPLFAAHNGSDLLVCNAVLSPKGCQSNAPQCILLTDSQHVSACQHCSPIPFTFAWVHYLAPLGNAITHVVAICASKQMIWPHACRIVAVMASVQCFGERAIVQLIGETMGRHHLSIDVQAPVTMRTAPRPDPALTEFWTMRRDGTVLVDFGPEAVNWGRALIQAVKTDEAERLTTDPAALNTCHLGDLRRLAATTFAEVQGRGRMPLHAEPPSQVRCATPEGVTSTARAFACSDYSMREAA